MKFLYPSLLFTSLLWGELCAQANNPLILDIIDPNALNSQLRSEHRYSAAMGSAYYQGCWRQGMLVTKDGKVYRDQVFKLDLYTQQILLKQDQNITRLATDYIVAFDLLDTEEMRERKFALAKSTDGLGAVYYEVLHLQKWALVKVHRREVVPVFNGAGTYGDERAYKFVNTGEVYLKLDKNAQPIRFDVSWPHIMDLFPEHRQDIKAFVKYNDLNIHQEKDLTKLIKHIEQLHAKMQH